MVRQRPKQRIWPLVLTLALVLACAMGIFFLVVSPTPTPPVPIPAKVQAPPPQPREVILYFAAGDATHLVTETRELADCPDEQECLRATVQALLDGPVSPLLPILPAQAKLRGASVADGVVTVDFDNELISGHPGGSISELLTVYGLADTLAANFPALRQLRILVEGAPVESLKGHVDLRQPIAADFTYARPSAGLGVAPPVAATTGGQP